jgi:transcriptional regulator GlxA family with amidase domain
LCHCGTVRRVVIVTYPGATLLDVVGPSEVLWVATRAGADPGYELVVASLDGGPAPASSGLVLDTVRLSTVRGPIDTLMVVGGVPARRPDHEPRLPAAIARMAPRCRRVTSVCTGAFLLAEAGVLDGRRATSHWAWCESLACRYPAVHVESDRIFVRDGDVWTSAGVTAGMDLALALATEDLGREAALQVARQLVMFVQRPGGQSQFSAQLERQVAERDPVRELQAWIVEHPDAECTVERLAERIGMSTRHFARVFRDEVGVTPAAYVEGVRVEVAQRLLETTSLSVDDIARAAGFGTVETQRRAFARRTGISPRQYRDRFRPARAS